MPKAFFRRIMPDPDQIKSMKGLGFLGRRLADPNIWHLNRHSASWATFWGLFCACLPMPMQMVPGALGAVLFRINLPLVIVMVWISNPLTMVPMLYVGYLIGSWMLNLPAVRPSEIGQLLEQSTQHMLSWFGLAERVANPDRVEFHLMPLLLGNVVLGLITGLVGFLVVRVLWRRHAIRQWERRRARRLLEQQSRGH